MHIIPDVMVKASVGCVMFACCYLSSCAQWPRYEIRPQDIPMLAADTQPPIELRAGFFMDHKLRELQYWGRASGCYQNPSRNVRLIEFDVCAAFEQATRKMFAVVVPLGAEETLGDYEAKRLDVVVSVGPPFCEADYGRGLVHVDVTANWAVTSTKGTWVTGTKVVGRGRAKPRRTLEGCRDALVAAFDAHFKKAYDEIATTAWLGDPSWKPR